MENVIDSARNRDHRHQKSQQALEVNLEVEKLLPVELEVEPEADHQMENPEEDLLKAGHVP